LIRPYKGRQPQLGARTWVDVSAQVRRELTEEERAGLRRYALNCVGCEEEYRRAEEAR
jgi:hypothetical protein